MALPASPREPKAPRNPLSIAVAVLLALLCLISISTAAYQVVVGHNLRLALERIDCQQQHTDQLRSASGLERDGLRKVFYAIKTQQPAQIQRALQDYEDATTQADAVRSTTLPCDSSNPGGT